MENGKFQAKIRTGKSRQCSDHGGPSASRLGVPLPFRLLSGPCEVWREGPDSGCDDSFRTDELSASELLGWRWRLSGRLSKCCIVASWCPPPSPPAPPRRDEFSLRWVDIALRRPPDESCESAGEVCVLLDVSDACEVFVFRFLGEWA